MFLIFTLKKVISSCLFRTLKKLTLFLTVYTVNIRVDEISFRALENDRFRGDGMDSDLWKMTDSDWLGLIQSGGY